MSWAQQRRPPGRPTTPAFDLRRGAIFGAGAWAFGVLLTAALAWIEFRELRGEQLADGSELGTQLETLPSAVDFVGWLFYNAHFVDVGFEVMGQGMWLNFVTADVTLTGALMGTMGASTEVAAVEAGLEMLFGTVPTAAWLLVPVATLVWAGYVVASRADVADARAATKAGTSVAVGYLGVAVVGTFLFTWTASQPGDPVAVDVGPNLARAAGLMGVVYPAVFGGIGGWLAARRRGLPARTPAGGTRGQWDHHRPPRMGGEPIHPPRGADPQGDETEGWQPPRGETRRTGRQQADDRREPNNPEPGAGSADPAPRGESGRPDESRNDGRAGE